MSSRRSIISYTLSRFLLSNLCCAVDRSITPVARLATREIDLKLDGIARLQPSYASKKQADQDSKYWGEVHKITVRLKRQTVKMVNKEQNADLHAIQADYDLVQQVLLAIEEKNNTHKYVMPTSASSLSIFYLCKSVRISKHQVEIALVDAEQSTIATIACFARPKSVSRFIFRSFLAITSIDEVLPA